MQSAEQPTMQSSQAPLPQQASLASATQPEWNAQHQVLWTSGGPYSDAIHTIMEQSKIHARQDLIKLLHLEKEKFAQDTITLTGGLMKLSMCSPFPLVASFFDDFYAGIFVHNDKNRKKGGLDLKLEVRLGPALYNETFKFVQESLTTEHSTWTERNDELNSQKRMRTSVNLNPETVDRQLRLAYLLFHLVRFTFHMSGCLVDWMAANDCFIFVHWMVMEIKGEFELYAFILKMACVSTTIESCSSEELATLGSIWERRCSGSHVEFIEKIDSLYQHQFSTSTDPYQEILGALIDVWKLLCRNGGRQTTLQVLPGTILRWKENSPPEAVHGPMYHNFIRTVAATAASECIDYYQTEETLRGTVDFLNNHIGHQNQERSATVEQPFEAGKPSVDDEAILQVCSGTTTQAPQHQGANPVNFEGKSIVCSGNIDGEDGTATEPQKSPNRAEDNDEESTPRNSIEDTEHESTAADDVSLASSEDTGLLTQEPMDEFIWKRSAPVASCTYEKVGEGPQDEEEASIQGAPGSSSLPIEVHLDDRDDRPIGSVNTQNQDPIQSDIDGDFNDIENLEEEEEEEEEEDYDEEHYMDLMNRAMERGFQEG